MLIGFWHLEVLVNTKSVYVIMEVYMDINGLRDWYLINGKPSRIQLRKGNIKLPYGLSERCIEDLLPIIKASVNNKTDFEETSVSGKSEAKKKTKIICSDFHIPFNDKEATRLFLKYLREIQPDEVIMNGNMNDCLAFSTHPTLREIPNALRSAKKERELWFDFAKALRETVPKAKLIYIGSQCHEGRIDKWVSLSPILQEDDNYTIENWFKLKDYGIDFIPEAYDPINEIDVSDISSIAREGTNLLVTHGTVCRSKSGISGMAEMEYNGVSTITGHVHRLSQVYKTTMKGTNVAIECGCMCERRPWYYLKGKRRLLDWQQGFVVLSINEDKTFSTRLVPILRKKDDSPFISLDDRTIEL